MNNLKMQINIKDNIIARLQHQLNTYLLKKSSDLRESSEVIERSEFHEKLPSKNDEIKIKTYNYQEPILENSESPQEITSSLYKTPYEHKDKPTIMMNKTTYNIPKLKLNNETQVYTSISPSYNKKEEFPRQRTGKRHFRQQEFQQKRNEKDIISKSMMDKPRMNQDDKYKTITNVENNLLKLQLEKKKVKVVITYSQKKNMQRLQIRA